MTIFVNLMDLIFLAIVASVALGLFLVVLLDKLRRRRRK